MSNTTAYKGYLIKTDSLGRCQVERDGYHIGWAQHEGEARDIVDLITGGEDRSEGNEGGEWHEDTPAI